MFIGCGKNNRNQRWALPAAGLFLGLLPLTVCAQIHDMRWVGGYLGTAGNPDYGGNKTLFSSVAAATSIVQEHYLNIYTSVGVFSDDVDSLIAFTDAWVVCNRNSQIMLNGTGLNPTTYLTPGTGFTRPASHIFLPWPGKPDSIALFHMIRDTVSATGVNHSKQLYLSIVDRDLDDGDGGVALKNHVLVEASLISGGLAAAKHANGRDWWVLAHGLDNSTYYIFLLTPLGVSGPFTQTIGSVATGFTGANVFNSSADYFASASISGNSGFVDLFEFDRCSGVLSNWQSILLDQPLNVRGAAFSPNGTFLYVSMLDHLLQFDLSNNVLGASSTVAVFDGFYDVIPQLTTLFSYMSLTADGRIYVSTGNGTRYMHVIHDPDAAGAACAMSQHEHWRQTWTVNSIPYRPNHLLGPVPGSACDSLGLSTGGLEPYPVGVARVQPNPSQGSFGITYSGQPTAGEINVLDAAGRIVYRYRLSAWSTLHQVALPPVAPGLYHCRLTWGNKAATVRVVITE